MPILPQVDLGDLYRNIYDFELISIDDTSVEKPKNQSENTTNISEGESAPKDVNNNLIAFVKKPQQLNEITIQFPNLPQTEIKKYQVDISSLQGNSFNIPRTKEQQELDDKLAEQGKKMEVQRQELYKKLEQKRKQRETTRKQKEKRLKQKRPQELRKALQKLQRRQQELQKLFSQMAK